MFTLMARKFISDIKAVIFAPFACISENLIPYCEECCVSFINRSDIIPCFTKHKFTSWSLFSRKKVVSSVTSSAPSSQLAQADHAIESLYQMINNNSVSNNLVDLENNQNMLVHQLNQMQSDAENQNENVDLNSQEIPQNPVNNANIVVNQNIDLFPPGDLFHIFKCQMGNFYLRKIKFDHFSHSTTFSTKLFRHHKIDSYKHAFNVMVENIY